MTTLPHQGLGARTRRVRAPGSRTAAPSFQNCRTVETMHTVTMLGHSYRLKRLLLVNINKSHGLPSCAVVLSKGNKRCWLQAAVQVNSICLNYSSFSGCSCATKPTDELHFLTSSPATPQVRPFECNVRNTASADGGTNWLRRRKGGIVSPPIAPDTPTGGICGIKNPTPS